MGLNSNIVYICEKRFVFSLQYDLGKGKSPTNADKRQQMNTKRCGQTHNRFFSRILQQYAPMHAVLFLIALFPTVLVFFLFNPALGFALVLMVMAWLNQAVSPLIPGGDNEITFARDGESFGVADTCQSATVPSYFKPYNTTTPVDWIASGAFMSYGYR